MHRPGREGSNGVRRRVSEKARIEFIYVFLSEKALNNFIIFLCFSALFFGLSFFPKVNRKYGRKLNNHENGGGRLCRVHAHPFIGDDRAGGSIHLELLSGEL
jgi:hypothetical protein